VQELTIRASHVQSRFYSETLPFSTESIFIFTLSSGDNIQITSIQEFIDTKTAADFAAAAASASQQ
jgi:hypothetical protein